MTGSGTLLDPYIIYDVDDLQEMRKHPRAYYELANNIDASATSTWNAGAGFLPIGNVFGDEPANVIVRPDADISSSGTWAKHPADPDNFYSKIDEAVADDDTSYVEGQSVGAEFFVSAPFTAGDIDADWSPYALYVRARVRRTVNATGTMNIYIRVNGSVYTVRPAFTPGTGYANYSANFRYNPDTGACWTREDLLGTGPNPLESMGMGVLTLAGGNAIRCTQMYAETSLMHWFTGPKLDGKGHTISNLYMNRPYTGVDYDIGFMGTAYGDLHISNLTIQDWHIEGSDNSSVALLVGYLMHSSTATGYPGLPDPVIEDVDVIDCELIAEDGVPYVGALCGMHLDTTTSRCRIRGLTISVTEAYNVGGLAGYISVSEVTDVSVEGNITIVDRGWMYAGGISGDATHSNFLRVWADVDFVISGNMTWEYAAGFIADIRSFSSCKRCFARGNITQTDAGGQVHMAGFATLVSWGGNAGSTDLIEDCYARSNLTSGHPEDDLCAGFIKILSSIGRDPTVRRCYSTGSVNNSDDWGGFIGNHNAGTVEDCYWDIETSGKTVSAAGTGKTTAEMKDWNTFDTVGWLDTIWAINPLCNDGYPCLLNVTLSCFWPPIPLDRKYDIITLPRRLMELKLSSKIVS